MKNNILIVACIAAFAGLASCKKTVTKQDNTSGHYVINSNDSAFIISMGYYNNVTLDAAYLAVDRTSDVNISDYGRKKVNETLKDRLNELATFRCLMSPTELTQEYIRFKQTWTSLSGKSFDSCYICREYEMNKYALDLIEHELKVTRDDVIVQFLCDYRFYINSHLRPSQCICDSYKAN